MSNKPLDLDFSDIEGKVERKELKKVLPKKKDMELSGVILTFKQGNKYNFKDMFECTSDEFLEWTKSVYPEVSVTAKYFESITERIKAFRQIQQFHLSMMTHEQRIAIH